MLACPADAIEHWGINKRLCSTEAQRSGFSSFIGFVARLFETGGFNKELLLAANTRLADFWQALRVGAGAYAGCLRCMEVCPVGKDYQLYLKGRLWEIPMDELRKQKKKFMYEQEQRGQLVIVSE